MLFLAHNKLTLPNFSDIIYFAVGRTNPKLIIDGTDFRLHNNLGQVSHWRCSFYFRTKCKCRAKTSGNVVHLTNYHNHETARLELKNLKPRRVTILRN